MTKKQIQKKTLDSMAFVEIPQEKIIKTPDYRNWLLAIDVIKFINYLHLKIR